MTIDCSKSGTELRVCLQGRLDSSTGDALESFLAENVTDGIEKLVLDFSGVDLISSKGLRVLVSAYKNLNGGNGTGTLKLYKRGLFGKETLIDEVYAEGIGCEFGEYDR